MALEDDLFAGMEVHDSAIVGHAEVSRPHPRG
jgi:hypothetical protein